MKEALEVEGGRYTARIVRDVEDRERRMQSDSNEWTVGVVTWVILKEVLKMKPRPPPVP